MIRRLGQAYVMEHECSSPSSQKPATFPCAQLDESNPRPLILFKNNFNIKLTSTPRFLEQHLNVLCGQNWDFVVLNLKL